MRRGASEADLHCSKCLGCLRGVAESRCPECGMAFDRAELRAVSRTSTLIVGLVAAYLVAVAVAAARLLTHALCGPNLSEFVPSHLYEPTRRILSWAGVMLASGLSGLVVFTAWRRLRRAARIRGGRGLSFPATALPAALLALAAAAIVYGFSG